jgi:hypothetical protein
MNKKNNPSLTSCFCEPGGSRTPNLLIRSQVLYPVELGARGAGLVPGAAGQIRDAGRLGKRRITTRREILCRVLVTDAKNVDTPRRFGPPSGGTRRIMRLSREGWSRSIRVESRALPPWWEVQEDGKGSVRTPVERPADGTNAARDGHALDGYSGR